eukprot:CAMPEP_0172498128 /NCGR_PEP_ID=MMETSP1066-20121228/109660_1 /TAXON_ID=671091 /ORGANISM="Coscinodiscus wailesii, Strain CCMP2513" /LENGTH=328 /DNA_ID=CAMNT_0013271277 /DNA_START=47 /DNA_END=1033 /DNA_ORIENTATION=+
MTVDLYPPQTYEADLTPEYPEAIDDACNKIYKACKGFGTDEKLLSSVLGATNPSERWLIANRYPELHKKNLYKLIKSETSRDWGQLCQLLASTPEVSEAAMIIKACKGFGTNEKLLYPIICGRSASDMNILKKTFYREHGKDLVVYVSSELSGKFKQLLVMCAQGTEQPYDETFHTEAKAKEDAEAYYKAGQGRWGTDEKAMFEIICDSPPEHLESVNRCYVEKYGYSMIKALEKELSGNVKNAAIYTLGMKLKPFEAMAEQIKTTCAGFGTDELGLSCCMVRYQGYMNEVMIAHEELFGETLIDRIRSETSAKYCKLLIALTGLEPY